MAELAPNDPINDFESWAELIGFVRKQEGDSGVIEYLQLIPPAPEKPWLLPIEERAGIITRETLEDAARELAERGLKTIARVVRRYAKKRPTQADIAPYPPGSTNHEAWQRRTAYLAAVRRSTPRRWPIA